MGFLFFKKPEKKKIVLPLEIEEKINQIVEEIRLSSKRRFFWKVVEKDFANQKIEEIKNSMLSFARNMYGKVFEEELKNKLSFSFNKKWVNVNEIKKVIKSMVIEFINWRNEVLQTITPIQTQEKKIELERIIVLSIVLIAFISLINFLPTIQKTGRFVYFSNSLLSAFLIILQLIIVYAVAKKFFIKE